MLFYKAKKEVFDFITKDTCIENALYTEKERRRLFPMISDRVFETVNISLRKTYWFFGCRFSD